MTYVSPTHSNGGSGEKVGSGDVHKDIEGHDPYIEYGSGSRKIDVSGMSYGHPDDGKAVEAGIGKAGDGGPESLG